MPNKVLRNSHNRPGDRADNDVLLDMKVRTPPCNSIIEDLWLKINRNEILYLIKTQQICLPQYLLIDTVANIKTTIGSQGVVSSQAPVGTNSTLTVAVPVNLTVSSGSNLTTSTTDTVHIYVSDINGSDSNSGTSTTSPLKTLASAVSKIPSTVKNDVVIHVGAHGGTGYVWTTIDNCILQNNASIFLYGDGAGQSGEDGFVTISGSAAAGAGSSDQVISGTMMSIDDCMGYTVEILTGPAAGDRRTIAANSTTYIVPVTRFSAAIAAGNTYRIIRPAVKISLPTTDNAIVLCSGLGPSIDGSRMTSLRPQTTKRSALVLVNLALGVGAVLNTIETQNSVVQMFGVEWGGWVLSSTGEVNFGITCYKKAVLPILTASSTAWHGWGLSSMPGYSLALYGSAQRSGVCVGVKINIIEGKLDLYSGRLKGTTGTGIAVGGNNLGSPAKCVLSSAGSTAIEYLGVTIETTSGTCILVSRDGSLSCPSLGAAPLILSSSTGTGISVVQAGICDISGGHNFAGGFSLTTGGWGVSVKQAGKIYVDHDMSGYVNAGFGAFTLDELTAYPAIAGQGVPGTIDNHYLVAQDGSAIISVD